MKTASKNVGGKRYAKVKPITKGIECMLQPSPQDITKCGKDFGT